MKSANVSGFFLFHYVTQWKSSFKKLASLYEKGDLQCVVDNGSSIKAGGFNGIDDIMNAVEYLYSKKSIGKVVVRLDNANNGSKL